MSERLKRLPPEARDVIAGQISKLNGEGVVTTASILQAVRDASPNTVTDRELEDAIAEAALAAGKAVDFDLSSQAPPADEKDARGRALAP